MARSPRTYVVCLLSEPSDATNVLSPLTQEHGACVNAWVDTYGSTLGFKGLFHVRAIRTLVTVWIE